MSYLRPATLSVLVLLLVVLISIAPTAQAQQVINDSSKSAPGQSEVYTCSMHPDVRASKAGKCFKCGMPLVRVTAPLEVIEYGLKFETNPTEVRSGEETALRFLILHPKTGEPIKEFNVVHDMPFHLFIVSQDLEFYDHIHPTQQPDGSFRINVALPKPGHYQVFSDFSPVGGTPQVIQRSLDVAGGHHGDHHIVQTQIQPDESLVKSVDGIRFELQLEPAQPVAGQPALLKYFMVDDKTGLPVKDFQPYLGAWGHSVSLREGATDFLHSHSTRLIPAGVDRSKLIGGPRISFNTYFAQPGTYRIWSQFQQKNRVITVPFTVYVSRLERIASWDGSSWSPLISPINGLDGPVRALAVSGNDVYLGGDFTTIGGVRANRISRWDGQTWLDLGGGVNGNVWAIAVDGRDVYVGGDFTTAGGKSANGVAKWDGKTWSNLGSGISGCKNAFCTPTVYALAMSGHYLYAGGRFSSVGGVPTNGIAKWNGQTWSALGEGVNTGIYDGVVRALAVSGSDVYAGGQFLMAGGVSSSNIARWNGRKWSNLGSGIKGNLEEVLAIGVGESGDVYVGGTFTIAGGVTAANIAKWSGRRWSALDVQPYDGVRKITVAGNNIYLGGGSFTLPGGLATKAIVVWNGSKWSALGTGVGSDLYTGPVMSIAVSGSKLYVGGDAFAIPRATLPAHHHKP